MSAKAECRGLYLPQEVRIQAQLRWLRWTIALWLSAVAALPWLQWAFSLWRGGLLRAALQQLRWCSFAFSYGALRGAQLRRLQPLLHRWHAAAHKDRSSGLVHDKFVLDGAVARNGTRHGIPHSLPDHSTVGADTRHTAQQQQRLIAQRERVSEVAWSSLAQQLAVFVAWVSVAERRSALRTAVSLPSACRVEFLLCAFSAWVMLTCRRRDAARAANHVASRVAVRPRAPRALQC